MPLLRSRPAISRTRLLLQFGDDVAVGGHALFGAKTVGAGDQRIGISEVQIIEVVAALVADAQHVLEAGGRDEAGLDALAFENGVGDDGGGTEHLKFAEIDTLPNRSSSSVAPCTTASAGFFGVLKTLCRCSSPSSSRRAKSVKVPPVSNASLAIISSERQFCWQRGNGPDRPDE